MLITFIRDLCISILKFSTVVEVGKLMVTDKYVIGNLYMYTRSGQFCITRIVLFVVQRVIYPPTITHYPVDPMFTMITPTLPLLYCHHHYTQCPRGPTLQKIVYEISKSFDFIEITLISGNFTDFIKITLIVKSRKCLRTTSANLDIFATCPCHVS